MDFKLNDMHKAMDDVFFTLRATENIDVDEAFALLGKAIGRAASSTELEELKGRTARAYDFAKCLKSWSETERENCAVPKEVLVQLRKDIEGEKDCLISTTQALVRIGKMLGTIGQGRSRTDRDKAENDRDKIEKTEKKDKTEEKDKQLQADSASQSESGKQKEGGRGQVEWNFSEEEDDWGPDPEWLKQ